jgi:predicted protein tyrosine phosphatase
MKFEILPFFKLQEFENNFEKEHIVIRYVSPGIDYPNIIYSEYCKGHLVLNCHDVENPMTAFNAKVLKDYPHFYKEPLIYFNELMAEDILYFIFGILANNENVDTIVCQCHAGISRSSATTAALSKILNNDDMWVFENKHFVYTSGWSVNERWVPNNLIYRTILKIYNESEMDK